MVKLFITGLAIYWLYLEVLQPRFFPQRKEPDTVMQRKKGTSDDPKRFDDDEGEYVDFEEIQE